MLSSVFGVQVFQANDLKTFHGSQGLVALLLPRLLLLT